MHRLAIDLLSPLTAPLRVSEDRRSTVPPPPAATVPPPTHPLAQSSSADKSSPAPATLASPALPPSTGGFKLKLKVSAPPPPPAEPAYIPPPPQPSASGLFGATDARYGGPPPAGVAYGAAPLGGYGDVEEERRVSASKYRKLKRKYLEAVESRDDASLALFRAQKLIHRLREEKSSLLDRVVQLEVAAGLTSQDVSLTRDQTLQSERELAFPLLHPPVEPSLAERPLKPPVLRTDTDLTNPNYNKPIGVPPLPETLAPRQRSYHLRTAIAAQKLRDDRDAQRAAVGLPKPSFPAVAVLGLEGSTVAANVERALAGEALEPVQHAAPRGNKRRRESSSGVGGRGGRARTSVAPAAYAAAPEPPAPVHNLPNPFAAIGAAIPVGASMSRNNAEALAGSASATPAPEYAAPSPVPLPNIPVAVPTPAPPPAPVPAPAPAPAAAPPASASTPLASAADDEYASMLDDPMSEPDLPLEDDEDDYKPKQRRTAPRKSQPGDAPGQSRPKKVRAHGLTTQTHNIPPIARNEDGSVKLPVNAGIAVIRALGVVDKRTNYHTERYIFPIGYEASRRYPSMVNPVESTDYLSRIVDGGSSPRFELYPADQPGVVVSGTTPTAPWAQVLKAANKVRDKSHSGGISGPEMYGLANNTVKAMIQELPGAQGLSGYVWQNFVEDPTLAPSVSHAEGRRGSTAPKKVTKRKSSAAQQQEQDEAVESPTMGGGGYDDSIAVGGDGEEEYDASYSVNGDGDYGVYDESAAAAYGSADFGANSLQHLLAAAGPDVGADPYAIPPVMPGVNGAAGLDPFLAVTQAAAAATPAFDPYAIPPSTGPMIDPAFAAFGDPTNAFAYGMPGQGQQ
ncbi:hypothetical protein JCM6882_008082 [Rhodosporidiobolus microsporus]